LRLDPIAPEFCAVNAPTWPERADFFLDFTFQWLYKRRMQQAIVAISINDGRENRTMATKKKAKKKKK